MSRHVNDEDSRVRVIFRKDQGDNHWAWNAFTTSLRNNQPTAFEIGGLACQQAHFVRITAEQGSDINWWAIEV
jgi:hypothetical protein